MPLDPAMAYLPVEEDLASMEEVIASALASPEPFLQEFLRHFRPYRGKRIRPALLFLFGRAFGRVGEDHVRAAAGAELLHVATLIHDDILDEASLRRKADTANRLWGNERSVLLGDWVFARAFETVGALKDPSALKRMVSTAAVVCQGEMLQICHRYDFGIGEARYLDLVRMKTGALFGFCCETGAALSGVEGARLEACRRYGEELGVAFQIIDDCLDLQGREEDVGKSLGTDVAKGKMTLPLIRALTVLPPEPREGLERAFRRGDGREEAGRRIEEAG
ncbi:MAG: polyprenyl synthetase family protein, partial [Planctomycetes bacterium]|nr:polyprenyl synthetase family protein [Planctomycetota bacterium]